MNPSETAAPGRAARKKAATRSTIVAAAVELFRRQGYDAVTMEHIAEAADVAKGTLYNYFPVKEAVLSAYIQDSFAHRQEERVERMKNLPGTRERLTLVMNELLEGIRSQPLLFEKYLVYQIRNLISLHREDGFQSGMRALADGIIRLGQESGEIRADLPFDTLSAMVDFVFVVLAQQYYRDPAAFKPQEAIPQVVDLFLTGVRSSDAGRA